MSEQPPQIEDAQLRVVFEEYRALYTLLVFRLGTMEQRLPIIAAILSATLGGTSALPPQVQSLIFIALPPALIWFLRTTVGHARSKHDIKTRIDEIERHVNRVMGAELLAFQSRHPSRGRVTAGRSGRELVLSVYFAALALLAGCVALYSGMWPRFIAVELYILYAALCGIWMSHDLLQLGRYRPRDQLRAGREEN